MTVLASQIKYYGSAVMAEDNTTVNVGGAIALGVGVLFEELTGLAQVVASAAGDTSQSVTVTYRTTAGAVTTEARTLAGTTPVAYTATFARVLKAVKSASTTGDVALEHQTATRASTAQAGSTAEYIILDAAASSTDGAYDGQVLRLTGGTGASQIRQVLLYEGAARRAWVSRVFDTTPDATTTFRIAPGLVFEKTPSELLTVRRPFYAAAADVSGGANREFVEKIFIKNTHATDALATATVAEVTDTPNVFTFALAAAKDDSGTATNRLTPPALTFDSANKSVPTGTLAAQEAIGTWLRLSTLAGQAALVTRYDISLTGATV